MERLLERVNRDLQLDISSLIRTVEEPRQTLVQLIAEISVDIEQLRQFIDHRIAQQPFAESAANAKDMPRDAEYKLKKHTHQVTKLRSSLLKLEAKVAEAKWVLARLGENSDSE
ncbi:hypothetical protein D0962_26000 [Leptolyngbyaceae cyanobacterium CCMR0082]|uniref:Uncharacterized protein n=1 Tax=Adonisia turfae CCMR0082 TaxID=2304604 RepID=A0A6M0SCI3_9CYAN|nr:hypothetical protein [Adonisia turfae]NEZ66174.1 hypothetical protein [Adonisia turfae CCMR0082]